MKKLFYSLLISSTLILIACRDSSEKSSDTLPPITQIGANTFGCKFNGIVFTPNTASGSTVVENALVVYGYYSDTENHSNKISAFRGRDIKNLLYIDVYIYKLMALGTGGNYIVGKAPIYDDNPPFNSYIKCRAKSPVTGQYKNYGSLDQSGVIFINNISADKTVISGVFNGKLKDMNGDEVIEITDGRFDINKKILK